MLRDDYLLRLIKQVADFLARIAGHNRKREFELAVAESERAWTEVLGVPRELVDVLDTPALAEMLREPDKLRAAAQLLTEEARAVAGKGDPPGAAYRYRRALELYLEARAVAPAEGDDPAIVELSREVPPGTIDPRYRS